MRRLNSIKERGEIVMSMIRAACASNKPCPTNSEFTVAMGMGSMSAGADVVSFLECVGMISVERSRTQRVVTITATGEKTAGIIKKPVTFRPRSNAPFKWTRSKDAVLMEAIANGLDFEQAAHLANCSLNEAAVRFDELAAQMGRQAA